MAKTRRHPKRFKNCVFCNYWMGDAELKFIDSTQGYEFEANAMGECIKRKSKTRATDGAACSKYEPNIDTKKLLQ